LVAAAREFVARVLDPDDRSLVAPRPVDEAGDVGDDRVALVCTCDDAVLHVDDKQCSIRAVLECGHAPFLPSKCVEACQGFRGPAGRSRAYSRGPWTTPSASAYCDRVHSRRTSR